ncbi:MAG: ABC transporter permease subunit [Turicibacter sp.]
MKDILILTRGELKKYFKLKSVMVGVIATILIMIGLTTVEYQDMKAYRENADYKEEVMSWREREENTIKFGQEILTDRYYTEIEREQITRRMEIAQYRLDHDLEKDIYKDMWWFFNDDTFEWIIRLIIIIVVFAGCANIGGEYSGKTINQVMLLPYKRYKILTGKILAMLSLGLILYSMVFVLGVGSGLVIHGFNSDSMEVILYLSNKITIMSMAKYSLIIVALKLVELVFSVALAVFIAILAKSAVSSSIIAMLVTLLATPLTLFASQHYHSLNYLPFTNLDFRRYLDFGTYLPSIESGFESVVVAGVTPMISAMIVLVSVGALIGISYGIFIKRDV